MQRAVGAAEDSLGGPARPVEQVRATGLQNGDQLLQGRRADDVDHVADIQKQTVSMDEVLVTGYQRAQKERGMADALSSQFQDEPVERLVGDGKP